MNTTFTFMQSAIHGSLAWTRIGAVLVTSTLVAITVCGCIAFPTQLADVEPFREELLDFLIIGQTTKGEVSEVMENFAVAVDGEDISVKLTPWQFRNGQWWLYVQSRGEFQWVLWLEGGTSSFGNRDYRFLLIKFDERDVIAGFETSSLEGNGCNREGVCKLGTSYILLAPDDEDQAAKALPPAANQCLVYLYPRKRSVAGLIVISMELVEASFDDEPGVAVASHEGYLLWPAQFGRHRISLIDPILGGSILTRELDCQRSEAWFFEYIAEGQQGDLNGRVVRVEEKKGRREISKRRLILMD
jgi:hypothetical protein